MQTIKSLLFRLNSNDFAKGLVMAILGGFTLPVLSALQTPGFSLATANWHGLLVLAEAGAVSSFSAYLIKNFFSDQNGAVLGKIG